MSWYTCYDTVIWEMTAHYGIAPDDAMIAKFGASLDLRPSTNKAVMANTGPIYNQRLG